MHWSDLIWVSYPLIETHHVLKYPRLKATKHWLIFWYIFMTLEMIELVTFQLLPFWSVIKPIVLFVNWKPTMTEISYKITNVWLKQGLAEVKKIESVNLLIERFKSLILLLTSQFDQNLYIKWVLWYLNNNYDQSPDQTKKIF
jgi:hypothetical protein